MEKDLEHWESYCPLSETSVSERRRGSYFVQMVLTEMTIMRKT